MRNLGEQWVEEIDGKEHMVKLVEGNLDRTHRCDGCAFHNEYKKLCEIRGGAKHISEVGCARQYLIIKDLGVLNEYGCLKSDFGIYPAIYRHVIMGVNGYMVKACATDPYVGKYAWGKTKQQAIDAWNRRV